MNRTRTLLASLAAVMCFTLQSKAQEPPAPGPEHKLLAEAAGTWDCTIKMEGVPGETKGSSVSKMEVGGLWLATDFSGDLAGMKFIGKGLDGYDAAKKKYVGIWVDSMGGPPMVMHGDFDKDKKTLTMTGEGPDMTGGMTTFKGVTTHTDKDHQTFTMSTVDKAGKEALMMTIEYVRKK